MAEMIQDSNLKSRSVVPLAMSVSFCPGIIEF